MLLWLLIFISILIGFRAPEKKINLCTSLNAFLWRFNWDRKTYPKSTGAITLVSHPRLTKMNSMKSQVSIHMWASLPHLLFYFECSLSHVPRVMTFPPWQTVLNTSPLIDLQSCNVIFLNIFQLYFSPGNHFTFPNIYDLHLFIMTSNTILNLVPFFTSLLTGALLVPKSITCPPGHGFV